MPNSQCSCRRAIAKGIKRIKQCKVDAFMATYFKGGNTEYDWGPFKDADPSHMEASPTDVNQTNVAHGQIISFT